MPARSAPKRGWSGRRARSFRSSISRRASAGSSISATAVCRPGCSTKRAAFPTPALFDYLKLAPIIWAGADKLVGDTIPCEGTLYQRLVQPLLLAALNCDPPEGSAGLAGAIVRETLLAGGQACRPLIARDGLCDVLVEPAVKLLQGRGASVRFGHELRAFANSGDRVSELDFGDDKIAIGPDDAVVLAVPPRPAAALMPGLKTPTKFRAIVNAHFRFDPPPGAPPILGVVGGLVEWLFAFPQRLSVTISNGDRLVDMPREELAQAIWRDVCKAGGVAGRIAPLADRARAPRHIRGDAGAECAAAGAGHGVQKPVSCRRLDCYGVACNHRGIGAVGRPCGRSGPGQAKRLTGILSPVSNRTRREDRVCQ